MSDAGLVQKVNDAALIKELVAHPGMKVLINHLEKKQANSKEAWLNAATQEEAEVIREKAKVNGLLMAELNRFLVLGSQAAQILKNKEQAAQQPSEERT